MISVLKNSGQTSAIFQEVGNTPLVREALMMKVINASLTSGVLPTS